MNYIKRRERDCPWRRWEPVAPHALVPLWLSSSFTDGFDFRVALRRAIACCVNSRTSFHPGHIRGAPLCITRSRDFFSSFTWAPVARHRPSAVNTPRGSWIGCSEPEPPTNLNFYISSSSSSAAQRARVCVPWYWMIPLHHETLYFFYLSLEIFEKYKTLKDTKNEKNKQKSTDLFMSNSGWTARGSLCTLHICLLCVALYFQIAIVQIVFFYFFYFFFARERPRFLPIYWPSFVTIFWGGDIMSGEIFRKWSRLSWMRANNKVKITSGQTSYVVKMLASSL